MSFESGYEPRLEEPGRARWLSYGATRTGHAWLLRHESERPWLICIHGLGMGWPLGDFTVFPPHELHQRLGLNLLYPVLPLHGPRRRTAISGDGFVSFNLVDTVHALAQVVWDLRRLVSWIRAQGGTQIGVYGLSLGGCSASLLACFEDGLACAIPGIAAADFGRLISGHAASAELRDAAQAGLGAEEIRQILRVVSPLALTPAVPRERRYLFGATADRLVPPEIVRDLWRHWERPRITWVQGSHLSAPFDPEVRGLVRDALRESGLVS